MVPLPVDSGLRPGSFPSESESQREAAQYPFSPQRTTTMSTDRQLRPWWQPLGHLPLPGVILLSSLFVPYTVDQTGAMVGVILGVLMGAGAAAAVAIYFSKQRKKEVQESKRCLLGQEVTLHCSIEGMFPEDVAVTWERICSKDRMVPDSAGDQKSHEHKQLLPDLPKGWRVTEVRAETCLTSYLTFTPTVQDDGAQVRCVFLHEAKGIREERVSPEIRVWARPQVSDIQVLQDWDPRDKVPFAVQVQSFYPREVPPIQWGWDGAGSWREDPAWIDKKADGTFTATSVWRVPSQSLTRPDLQVRVCVQRGPGEPPSERELSLRDTGLLRPPEVSEISRTESVAKGKGVTLSCRITGHFPGELSVTWLRRGKGEPTAVILRDSAEWRVEPGTAILARDGKSFQQETRLTLLTAKEKGAEYICRAGHLTLETPIERSNAYHPCLPDLGEVSHLQALIPGQPVNAQHLLSRSYPRQVAMTWLRKRAKRKEAKPLESSDLHRIYTPAPSWAPDGKSCSMESELRVPPTGSEDDSVRYQCHVEREALKKPRSRSSGQLQLQGHSESPRASKSWGGREQPKTEAPSPVLRLCPTQEMPGCFPELSSG